MVVKEQSSAVGGCRALLPLLLLLLLLLLCLVCFSQRLGLLPSLRLLSRELVPEVRAHQPPKLAHVEKGHAHGPLHCAPVRSSRSSSR